MKEVFLGFSGVLVPLGLMAWIAFSIPLIFVNGSYILNVVSDPMGRGWDLLGRRIFPGHRSIPSTCRTSRFRCSSSDCTTRFAPVTGSPVDRFGRRAGRRRACAPVAILSTAMSCGFLWIFVG